MGTLSSEEGSIVDGGESEIVECTKIRDRVLEIKVKRIKVSGDQQTMPSKKVKMPLSRENIVRTTTPGNRMKHEQFVNVPTTM